MTEHAGRVEVSRRIPAPAAQLFAALADPGRHPGLDGSGMLRQCLSPGTVSRTGELFVIRMHNSEMGEYEMTNRIVAFEQDRRIAWEPVMSAASRPEDAEEIGVPGGQVWAYQFEPDGPEATWVTAVYDCTKSPDHLKRVVKFGQRWVESLGATLERLEQQSAPLLRATDGGEPADGAGASPTAAE